MTTIDINCDTGESYGNFKIGNDEAIMPYITSASIACGFHGGDPYHIEKTIESALKHNVQIGAHPGYPDLQGFGRRKMVLKKEELRSTVKYQVAALKSLVESHGSNLKYVKPHGALYNSISNDSQEGKIVIRAIKSIDSNLKFLGLAGSLLQKICEEENITFVSEGFADRRYDQNGKLVSRHIKGALISNPETATAQVLSIFKKNQAATLFGRFVKIHAESFCIHGDNPNAVETLQQIEEALENEGIKKLAF